MKTKLLSLIAIFSFTIAFSQTIITFNPGDDVNDTVLYYSNTPPPGNIVYRFNTGTYNVNQINVSSGQDGDKITFESVTGNATDVKISSADQNVFYITASHVYLNNLTIENAGGANGENAIMLQEEFIVLDSVFIQNCIINADADDNDNGIIYQGSTSTITNIFIRNCTINNGGIGINMPFSDASNIVIENNIFQNQKNTGINLSNIKNLKLTDNNITMPTTGNLGNNTATGIYLSYIYANGNATDSTTLITRNRIHTNTTQTCNLTGISIENGTTQQYGTFLVSNNFINIENNDNLVKGFSLFESDILIYNNTVKLIGNNTIGVDFSLDGFGCQFENNLIQSSKIVFNSSNGFPSILDYNCYFANDSSNAFSTNGAGAFSFSQWQSTSGGDANSVFENPQFIGFNNPEIHNPSISNHAMTVPEVAFDIDGVARPTNNCDYGAKEVAFVNLGNDTSVCYGEYVILDAGPANTYSWNTGGTTQIITVDTTGQYIVTITEVSGGATATDTINVTVLDEIDITFTPTNPLCYGSSDGSINTQVTGGTGSGYVYNWSNGGVMSNITNLTAGQYILTVTDSYNCTNSDTVELIQPSEIIITTSVNEFCGGCNGEIYSNATGGTPPYNYIWDNSSTNDTVFDLCEGMYNLTITDANGCEVFTSQQITESELAYITGTVDYSGGNFNANEIKVELYKQFNNGSAYQIERVDTNMIDANSNFVFTDVPSYTYTFRAIDAQNSYTNVFASYYNSNGTTTTWEGAEYVTVGCEDTLNITFSMFETTNLNGYGTFGGTITYINANKSINLAGEPVTGAEIYIAQDPNNEPIADAVTDDSGDWEVDSIQEGTGYNLRVDIPGLNQISTYENLSVNSNDTVQTNLNFIVDTTSGGGIMVDTTFSSIKTTNQIIEIKVYPNPSTNFVSFETSLKSAANIKFEIVNIKGETLYTSEELNNYVGDFKIKVDISDYAIGTYLLKFKIDNNYYLKKIIKQ